MSANDFRLLLRVYWEDTDAGGVVFYANYLKFFERARTEWLRSLGHEQERLRTETGAMFVVADTTVRYLRPARLDDLLAVTVRVAHAGLAQMTIAQQAFRLAPHGEELLADGTIRIGFVDAGTFRPQRVPISIVDSLSHTTPPHNDAAGRAPGRSQAGPRPLGGPPDACVGRGAP